MRTISLIISIIVFMYLNAYSQDSTNEKYVGGYFNYNDEFDIYQEIKILENGSFIYIRDLDVGAPMHYYGKWWVKGDRLILKEFNLDRGRYRFFQNWCNIGDTTSYAYLYLYYNNNFPFTDFEKISIWSDDDTTVIIPKLNYNTVAIKKSDLPYLKNIKSEGYYAKVKYKERKGNCLHIYWKGSYRKTKIRKFPLRKDKLWIKDDGIIRSNGDEYLRIK